jgi:hypothetical protein
VEIEALFDLYKSTNGVHWSWLRENRIDGYQWNFTSNPINPCDENHHWQGITCDVDAQTTPASCHITALDLEEYSLHGK